MRTHLVTGAGSGIGAAVADALAARGDRLVLLARSAERAGELSARWPGATAVVADLADPASLAGLGDSLPATLDSVIHSAGIADLAPVAEATYEMWTSVLNVDLVSPALLSRECLPAVRRAAGLFVFVNSGAGLFAHEGWSPYSAAKFGLRALGDSLRAEEAGNGVRVTT
ncbi:MAG: SDR family NAD(P)-dependent oxidoreductase, partial [Nocardioides sp.]